MAQSLFEHGAIRSTVPKIKEVRSFAEKLITLAKKAHGGSLAARQRVLAELNDRAIIPLDHFDDYASMSDAKRHKALRSRSGRRHRTGQPRPGQDFTAQSIVHKLINEIAPRFKDRDGGYTRVIRVSTTRIGDGGAQAILQLIGDEEAPTGLSKPEKSARKRRIESRYAFAARVLKRSGKASPEAPKPQDEPAPEAAAEEPAGTPDTEAAAETDADKAE